jgi:hypothetical protein
VAVVATLSKGYDRADEREAHIREVEQYGQTLPEGSY